MEGKIFSYSSGVRTLSLNRWLRSVDLPGVLSHWVDTKTPLRVDSFGNIVGVVSYLQ